MFDLKKKIKLIADRHMSWGPRNSDELAGSRFTGENWREAGSSLYIILIFFFNVDIADCC